MYIKLIFFIIFLAGTLYSQIGDYIFTNSTTTVSFPSGYTIYSINGGGGNADNGFSLPITIPFPFNFGGTDFTQYVMCSNGFLAFGTSLTASEYSSSYNMWTGTRNDVICYTGRDLLPDVLTSFAYVTEGTAPNRVHKMLCLGLRTPTSGLRGNCQIYLYEGSNKIEIIYSAFPTGWTGSCRVGLRGGSSGSADLKTLSGTGAAAWTNPTAGNTNNATMNQSGVNADNGRIYTFFYDPTPMFYVSSNVTQTLTSSVYAGATNQQLIGIEIVTGGYLNILNLTGITLNTNGSTNAGDIANAKLYYTGVSNSFSTAAMYGTVYNLPTGSFVINGSQALLNGINYFWLTYDISTGATGGNVVDAECNQLTLSGIGGTQVPTVQAPPGNRLVIPALTSVNVGTGETYTSLTNTGGLFEAINAGSFPIAANITVNITSNLTETGTVNLNDWGNSYSLNIVPSAAVERLISGSNATSALLTLSGADNVNIDGRFGGSGKFLRLRNTSGSKPTIQFMNDSRKNTIRDCYIESNNTQASTGLGTILFSTTTGTNGNDSNIIMNCDIRNRSDLAGNPVYGIVCMGNSTGTTTMNSDNVISGCNIYNFNSSTNTYGIYLLTGTGSNWRIENNSFYNTASIAATLWYAVFISSTTDGNQQILNNYIGGNAPNCGGTLTGTLRTMHGIYLRAASTTTNTVSGNIIRNINLTKTSNSTLEDGFIGINTFRSGNNITNNVIGDTTTNDNVRISGAAGITMYSFFIKSDSAYATNISGNIAGSITFNIQSSAYFRVITCTEGVSSSSFAKHISNNKIGSFTLPNSIRITSSTFPAIYCIETSAAGGYGAALLNITNNSIANISTPLAGSTIVGINGGSSYNVDAVHNVIGNVIYNLTSQSVYGINFSMYDALQFSGGTLTGYLNVKNNTISGLTATSNVWGMYHFTKADYNDVSGNKIYNIVNTNNGGYILGLAVRSNYFFPNQWPFEKNLVYNNQISITNGESLDKVNNSLEGDSYTNSLYIIGIDIDHGDSARILNNTVYIGGTEGANQKSECLRFEFYNGSNTNPDVRNNLFVNNRSGSGDHLAITVERPDTNIIAGTFNYNTYITPNTNKVCQWFETLNNSFDQWKANSQSDKQSWAVSTAEINPANLFINAGGGNLNINYNNPEAWIVSGKGLPLSYVSADYEGNTRSTSVLYNYPTDIGSDEFTQTPPNNPNAIETGAPGPGSTTSYKLYGRTIMQIDWAPGGSSYPTGMNVKYYSCVEPPGITGGYGYSYWNVTPTGTLSSAAYDITVNFGDNETHSITSPSVNTRLAKRDAEWVPYIDLGTGNLQTELDWPGLKAKVRGLDSFSDFALIDFSNPLPVNICRFDGSSVNRNVVLSWQTCSEINNAGFEIERRKEDPVTKQFTAWQKTGFVPGHGTTTEPKNYSYEDRKLSTGNYQYRLKQLDLNGSAEYYQLSNPDIIEIAKPVSFEMSQNYPNPSNPSSKIDYQIPFNGKVNLVIYDLLGREVFKLVNDEIKEAGYYTAEFNGSQLASGVYIYRIVTEGDGQKFTKTLKMVLLK